MTAVYDILTKQGLWVMLRRDFCHVGQNMQGYRVYLTRSRIPATGKYMQSPCSDSDCQVSAL